MAKVLKQIPDAPIKIEIGSGNMPQEGYWHVDIDQSLPHVEIVCRVGDEALPLKDSSVSEILSNHSIEHIPWPKVRVAVEDWFRVLAPGGKIFLRTPDLEFIAKVYLAGTQTPEAPADESKMMQVFHDCGPAHWANIKLFAGQDYPGNFHYFCFDFKMLKGFLSSIGFERIERVSVDPVFSPGEIQAVAYKPI